MTRWLAEWWPYLLLGAGLAVMVRLAGPLIYLIVARGLYSSW